MRFQECNAFPGSPPSSTQGSCRACGIGRLREGDTGVILTDWWIDMEGMIVLCQACTAELGRLVPDPEKARLEGSLSDALDAVEKAVDENTRLRAVIVSQRDEFAMVPRAGSVIPVAARRPPVRAKARA